MAHPEPLSVDDALDRLVNQFSDSMAFFRELIQNALDAGSEEVEIHFEHRDDASPATMIIHVEDWGAGMNREIIDTRLTRLFSSSKDGDRTKIGKFGIGFVSVFAIEPTAVCIDTSREGEHWRIVFDEQRRFSLIRRDEPVEGTKIQIFKPADRREFAAFRARAREVIRYWCRHVEGEIRVEGELINAPFDLDAPCKVSRVDGEEHIVVAHPEDGESFSGFYNRGLTLVEEQLIEGIAFKASSAKLEHTLTRDDVIRDRGFHRLMDEVRGIIRGELREQVFARLAGAVDELDPTRELEAREREALDYLWGAARWHLSEDGDCGPEQIVACSPGGEPLSLAQLRKARGEGVIVAPRPSALTEVLEQKGQVVVWEPAGSRLSELLAELAPKRVPVARWCTALPPRDSDEAVRWQVLASAVARLLDDWGAKVGGVRLGHLDYPDSMVADRVAITQAEFGEATPLDEASELGTGLLSSRRVVVLNADHPTIRKIAALAHSEPELAAYFGVKAFFLGTRLDAKTDEELAGLTFDIRTRRRAVG